MCTPATARAAARPTSIELGCADPDLPCKLPNAMAGDPPLEQVVTRTIEAGLRGETSPNARTNWTVGFFTAENDNDILFVSSTQSGFGYFKNFGNTRRQGVELSLSTRTDRVSYGRRLHLPERHVSERRDGRRIRQQLE